MSLSWVEGYLCNTSSVGNFHCIANVVTVLCSGDGVSQAGFSRQKSLLEHRLGALEHIISWESALSDFNTFYATLLYVIGHRVHAGNLLIQMGAR